MAIAGATLSAGVLPAYQRAEILDRAAARLRDRLDEFAASISAESAKPITTDRLQRITEFLERAPEVVFALLFGSRAAGTARPDSDYDVAVWLQPPLDDSQRHDWLRRADAALTPPDDVDLVVLNEAPALLGHRALMGRILWMRDRAAYSL